MGDPVNETSLPAITAALNPRYWSHLSLPGESRAKLKMEVIHRCSVYLLEG